MGGWGVRKKGHRFREEQSERQMEGRNVRVGVGLVGVGLVGIGFDRG